VPNVIGLIMYDFADGDDLSNDIEISTTKETTIPGFLIDYRTGQDLLQQVNQMRASDDRNSSDPLWVKVTLQFNPLSAAVQGVLQFILLFVMVLLTLAFATSIYVHYRIYRLQQELGDNRLGEARDAIVIDEAFLEKLPIRRFRKWVSPTTSEAAGVSEKARFVDSPTEMDAALAVVEADEGRIHAHAPPNETCPICLDEFFVDESLNELPCGHFYHMSCIQPWLQFRSPECPLCKEDVRDAFITLPEPTTAQTASRTCWSRGVAWTKRTVSCLRTTREPEIDHPGAANMTEVRIVTPTATVEDIGAATDQSRDGTLYPVPLVTDSKP